MPDKIINTFQQRRELTQEIVDLGATQHEQELLTRVRMIARRYPADLILAALVKQLDTTNSQLRGGVGHLASLLPPDQVTPALRAIAAGRQYSAQSRVTAALILERYLGESVPPALLSDLNQTNEVAFQSLREAVDEGRHNRHVLLEYVTQMRQAGEEIAFMVMDLMQRLPPDERVELFRLIALDDRAPVASVALAHLEQLAHSEASAPSLVALHTLTSMLPPDLAAQAGRSLRKLQFGGIRYTPPAPAGWRALISTADLTANQSIWFVRRLNAATGSLLGVILNPASGILHAFGSDAVPHQHLPASGHIGELVSVRSDSGEAAVMLEAPFDFGRWRLQAALAAHWRQPTPRPLPAEFRLYGAEIWQYAPPAPDPALVACFAQPPGDPAPAPDDLDALLDAVLSHPAFAGWSFLPRGMVEQLRAANLPLETLPVPEFIQLVLRELERRPESGQVLSALADGLRAQAAWLKLAGSAETADRALRLAALVPTWPLNRNPLLARLIKNGLTTPRRGQP